MLTAQSNGPIKNPARRPGFVKARNGCRSADLHVSEFAGHVRWHVRGADAHARAQTLLLIPPATPLSVGQEPQVLPVRKNIHRSLPESDCEIAKRIPIDSH